MILTAGWTWLDLMEKGSLPLGTHSALSLGTGERSSGVNHDAEAQGDTELPPAQSWTFARGALEEPRTKACFWYLEIRRHFLEGKLEGDAMKLAGMLREGMVGRESGHTLASSSLSFFLGEPATGTGPFFPLFLSSSPAAAFFPDWLLGRVQSGQCWLWAAGGGVGWQARAGVRQWGIQNEMGCSHHAWT